MINITKKDNGFDIDDDDFEDEDDDWNKDRGSDNSVSGEKFFIKRGTQLDDAKSEEYPDVLALFSELIQNSDDA